MNKRILSVALVYALITCISIIPNRSLAQETQQSNFKIAVWGFSYLDQDSRSMCRYIKGDIYNLAKNSPGVTVIDEDEVEDAIDDQSPAAIAPDKSIELSKDLGANVAIWGMISANGSIYNLRYFMTNTKTEEIKSDVIAMEKARSKRREKVKELIDIAKGFYKTGEQMKMEIALNLFNSKNYEDAKQAFKEVLKLNPEKKAAYNYLGYIEAVQEDYDQAVGYYRKALEIDSTFIGALEGLAWTYKTNQELSNACTAYERLADIDPNHIEYMEKLGDTWKNLGNEDEALKAYEGILEVEPNNFNAHEEIGLIHYNRENYNKAIEHLKKVVSAGEGGSSIARKLAVAYQKTDRLKESIAQNKQLIEQDPSSPTPYLNLAAIYAMQKNFEQAETELKKFIELQPDSPTGYMRIADVYRQMEEYEKAKENAQKAAELAPDDPGPYLVLAEIANSRGYVHYDNFIKYDEEARKATQKTYDELDKLRSQNKKTAYNYFESAETYYNTALEKASSFFAKENIKKKLEKVAELKKATKPGFFDE